MVLFIAMFDPLDVIGGASLGTRPFWMTHHGRPTLERMTHHGPPTPWTL